jgi:DNA helicase HerA-like ATPase
MSDPAVGPDLSFGKIVQSRSRPLLISAGRRRLSALISEAEQNQIRDGMYLMAEEPDGGAKVVCRVAKLESYPQHSSIAFHAIDEFVTEAELEPLSYFDHVGSLPVTNADLNGFQLRRCRADELASFFQLPAHGIPCGNLVIDGGKSELAFPLPADLLFRSAFVCGAKGSGKTTFLRELLPQASVGDAGEGAAIVILDVEGEFSEARILSRFTGAGADVKTYRLSTDSGYANATLGLAAVHYEDFAYFAPNLPLNSMLHLESIVKELAYHYKQAGRTPKASEMLADIQRATWRRASIHHFQREAIIRATAADVFGMFDQSGLPPVIPEGLVHARQASILDVSSLTDDQQRIVALYLLSTLARMKDRAHDSTGVMVVMDEAQKLFPHKGDLKPEYAERLGKFVGHIVHRGRRRRFGIVLSTQYPADVSRDIVDLCDTKFVFRMSGPHTWLKATLPDPDSAVRVTTLPVGEAFVVSTAMNTERPVQIVIPAPDGSDSAPRVASVPEVAA